MNTIRKYTRTYNYAEVEVKSQILKDVKQSNQINNQSSKYLFSWLSQITRNIHIIKYAKIILTKKPIVELSILIVGTIATYAIMKYTIKWFL